MANRYKTIIQALKKDPTLWNGKIYKNIIYVKGFAPLKVNKKSFLKAISKQLCEQYELQTKVNKESYKLDQEFKRVVAYR